MMERTLTRRERLAHWVIAKLERYLDRMSDRATWTKVPS
jgi:hypothetical protein